MAIHREQLSFSTPGRRMQDITSELRAVAQRAGREMAMLNCFSLHTSCSLVVCENACPDVRGDFEAFLSRLVPDGDSLFNHTLEGPDDMPAHVRTMLTQTSLTLPVQQGQLLLGTWQGVYLCEHRIQPHKRTLVVSVFA